LIQRKKLNRVYVKKVWIERVADCIVLSRDFFLCNYAEAQLETSFIYEPKPSLPQNPNSLQAKFSSDIQLAFKPKPSMALIKIF
jgi:hypothetical protein